MNKQMSRRAAENDEQIKERVHALVGFQNILKTQAVTDARHDLETSFTSIYNELKHIGAPNDAYGAPLLGSGWDVVKSSIDLTASAVTAAAIPSSWRPTTLNTPRQIERPIVMNHTGFRYTLRTMNINETTPSLTLYNFITNNRAGVNELSLILDATTGSFMKVLQADIKRGEPAKTDKTIYILVNRETISDPAGKPNESDPTYNEKNNKSRHINLFITPEISTDKVIYSSWSERTDYHSDFFSNFHLILEPVIKDEHDYKSVLLTFVDRDYKNKTKIETTASGKLANSRNAMKAILDKIYEHIAELKVLPAFLSREGSKDSKPVARNRKEKTNRIEELQDYFVALQKKRSGDALIALSYFDKSRTYQYKSKTFTFNDKPLRFVLTHDTFNTLPVGLINGVNLIYTGAEQDGQQTIYIFEREGEETDFLELFYNNYLQTKTEGDKIIDLLKKNKMDFDGKEKEIVDELNEKIKEVEDTYAPILSIFQSLLDLGKRITTSSVDPGKLVELQKTIRETLELFYKLALYRSVYKTEYIQGEFDALIKKCSTVRYTALEDTLKSKLERLKNIYYKEKDKVKEFRDDEKDTKFEDSLEENLVYKGIRHFDILAQRTTNYGIIFGTKTNKFTFGMCPVILHHLSSETDKASIDNFITILNRIHKDSRLVRDPERSPMKDILTFFLTKQSADQDATTDILEAITHEVVPTNDEQKVRLQNIAAPNCVVPYHSSLVRSFSSIMSTMLGTIETKLEEEKGRKDQAGGQHSIDETDTTQLYYYLLLNFSVEMNVYFTDKTDIYAENLPMAGALLLNAMKFSDDPISIVLFFIRMSYYNQYSEHFSEVYKHFLENKYLVFLPSIFNSVLYTSFGKKFVDHFNEVSLELYPKIMKKPHLKALMYSLSKMKNPTWAHTEAGVTTKLYQFNSALHKLRSKSKSRVHAHVHTPIKMAPSVKAHGGSAYKKTKKLRRSQRRRRTRRNKE